MRYATYQTSNAGGVQGGSNLPFNEEESDEGRRKGKSGPGEKEGWGPTAFKMFESAMTTFASIAVLG